MALFPSQTFALLTTSGPILMQIDARHSDLSTLQQRRRAQDKNVQSVFRDVLASVGREGYQSAIPVDRAPRAAENPQSLDENVQNAWDGWYRTERLGRYRTAEDQDAMGREFGEVLAQANREGGYVNPRGFLNDLSNEQLDVVRRVHWLADSIDVDSLSEEGALNLLLPPAAQVDLNRDGITQSGAANGLRFPDSTTPADVAQAWEQATDGMDWGDRAVYELQMKLPVLVANMSFAPDGSLAYQRQPGDPDFTNPMAAPDYSYTQAAQDQLDYLEYFRQQIDPTRYQTDTAFWTDFRDLLTEGQ